MNIKEKRARHALANIAQDQNLPSLATTFRHRCVSDIVGHLMKVKARNAILNKFFSQLPEYQTINAALQRYESNHTGLRALLRSFAEEFKGHANSKRLGEIATAFNQDRVYHLSKDSPKVGQALATAASYNLNPQLLEGIAKLPTNKGVSEHLLRVAKYLPFDQAKRVIDDARQDHDFPISQPLDLLLGQSGYKGLERTCDFGLKIRPSSRVILYRITREGRDSEDSAQTARIIRTLDQDAFFDAERKLRGSYQRQTLDTMTSVAIETRSTKGVALVGQIAEAYKGLNGKEILHRIERHVETPYQAQKLDRLLDDNVLNLARTRLDTETLGAISTTAIFHSQTLLNQVVALAQKYSGHQRKTIMDGVQKLIMENSELGEIRQLVDIFADDQVYHAISQLKGPAVRCMQSIVNSACYLDNESHRRNYCKDAILKTAQLATKLKGRERLYIIKKISEQATNSCSAELSASVESIDQEQITGLINRLRGEQQVATTKALTALAVSHKNKDYVSRAAKIVEKYHGQARIIAMDLIKDYADKYSEALVSRLDTLDNPDVCNLADEYSGHNLRQMLESINTYCVSTVEPKTKASEIARFYAQPETQQAINQAQLAGQVAIHQIRKAYDMSPEAAQATVEAFNSPLADSAVRYNPRDAGKLLIILAATEINKYTKKEADQIQATNTASHFEQMTSSISAQS
ncbi:hypothetical protein ACFL0V_04500 [Nanoarchaeota archaeon]